MLSFIPLLLNVPHIFNCSLNFRCKILHIDIANKTCLLLKITCSLELYLLLALHLYKFCDTLQVLLSTHCTQSYLNCCSRFEAEPTPDNAFFAPGTEGFDNGSS